MNNKAKLKLSIFFISILVSCQRPMPNKSISGVWIQEDDGGIITIKDSIYTYFKPTNLHCLNFCIV